jgi:type II secretory pathway component GspD/PulD (secretin)
VNIELIIPLNDADKRFTKFSHNGRAILNENEALVLSGLVQQIYSMNIERTPFLGKIPILNFFFGIQEKTHDQEELAVVVMPRRPSTASAEVTGTMRSTKEMQNIIIETAPSMGPVPENPKNSRPVKEK